jgi:hypothetical protein
MPRSRNPTPKTVENEAMQAAKAAQPARARRAKQASTQIRPPARLPQVLAKPDAAIEGIGPTQKQQTIGLLTILAEAADKVQAGEVQVRNSEQPESRNRELFDDADSFLREFSPITPIRDREASETPAIRETVPPLPLRPSPKANRFMNVAAEIVGLPTPTVEESEDDRPEVHFIAAGYVGKEKAPCYSKIFPTIWDFQLFSWESEVVATAERKWSPKGFKVGKESTIATVSAKNIKPSILTVHTRDDWQAAVREVEKLNARGASSIRVELRIQLEISERPDEKDDLTTSDSDLDLRFLSSRKRGKATPASKKGGNSKIEKQLALERGYRLIDQAELNNVPQIIQLHECSAGSCRNNSLPCVKVGDEHVKITHDQLGAWSRAINKGKATLETPHSRLQEWIEGQAAAQAKARETKQQKKKKQESRSDEDSSSSSRKRQRRRRRRSRSRDPMPFFWPMPQQYYPPPPPPPPSIPSVAPAAVEQRASRPVSSGGPAPPSSPIRPAVKNNVLMDAYIDWLKDEKPEKSHKYDEALRLMHKEDVYFHHLLSKDGGITRAQLQGIGLTVGIAIDVKERAKPFRMEHPNLFIDDHDTGLSS